MLSELPDDVLCHILSFLPTKTSVSTSVLAKRWRFLWAHVPNLQFNVSNFRYELAQPFDIMNRVVTLHQAKVVNTFSFRLAALNGCAYRLLTLITHLIMRNVRNLYIEFGTNYEYGDIVFTFPILLSTCKTLVDLKLVYCGVIPSSDQELFLPSLKKLNLTYVDYESDESLPHLLSGCPVIEELIVIDRFRKGRKNLGCVIVSSPTVKKMIVGFSQGHEEYSVEMLLIDVPALVYLKVDNCDLERVRSLSETMNSLIEADIAATPWHYCGVGCTNHGRSIEFLSCLCHVKCLKITRGFQLKLGSMPEFVHLTKLEIECTVNWYDLVKFLEDADNLEDLIIILSEMLPYKEPERVPTCMSSSLRSVRMYDFSACDDGFETVRYVLRNARALERMEIYPATHNSSDKDKLIDAFRMISLFERGSTSCQLDFNNAD